MSIDAPHRHNEKNNDSNCDLQQLDENAREVIDCVINKIEDRQCEDAIKNLDSQKYNYLHQIEIRELNSYFDSELSHFKSQGINNGLMSIREETYESIKLFLEIRRNKTLNQSLEQIVSRIDSNLEMLKVSDELNEGNDLILHDNDEARHVCNIIKNNIEKVVMPAEKVNALQVIRFCNQKILEMKSNVCFNNVNQLATKIGIYNEVKKHLALHVKTRKDNMPSGWND